MPRISLFSAPAHKVRSYVRSLAQKERALSVRMLRAHSVVERRRLYHPYPSLYEYCRGDLKMSEAVAYTRSRLARTAQRYPTILLALRDGRLNLSGLLILNKCLRPENAEELLRAAESKTNQHIKELLARRFPQPDVPTIVVPELLSHAVAAGDVAAVMDRALDALIAELEKKLIGSTENPRPRLPTAENRHVPLAVQAEVIARDGWRCSFPMPDGGVCGSRWRLQFHHLVSVAKGGQSVAKHLVLRCSAHHRHETEREFGLPFVEGKIERRLRESALTKEPGSPS
jgi:hypothetical protein